MSFVIINRKINNMFVLMNFIFKKKSCLQIKEERWDRFKSRNKNAEGRIVCLQHYE